MAGFDVLKLLNQLPEDPFIDLVVTSPPYNIGKSYESHSSLEDYFINQKQIIKAIDLRVKKGGSICWQVGNHITKDGIYPLDYGFHEIFIKLGYTLKNRIVWKFGHGMSRRIRRLSCCAKRHRIMGRETYRMTNLMRMDTLLYQSACGEWSHLLNGHR